MANKDFGVKQINLIGASGTPTITSPNNLVINATSVDISTDLSIGGEITSNIIVGSGYSIGIGTTAPISTFDVFGDVKIIGDVNVGLDNSQGLVMTSPNGTQYRLIVDDSGNLSTSIINP